MERKTFLLLILLLSGCVHSKYESIILKPPSSWTKLDCQTIVASAMARYGFDIESSVRIYATPYYPSVVTALSKMQQERKQLTEGEYQRDLDQLAKESMGIYYDAYVGRFMDPHGNYVRDRLQIDSLLFLVTIENKTFPCVIPFSFASNRPIADLMSWPCYIPLLTDLEERIYLQNERGDRVKPRYILGRKGSQLFKDETMLMVFPLRQDGRQFLEESETITMVILGFGEDIRLRFPLEFMR
ncbi:MAG: hypothetical protein HY033_01475 [Ignavibacteriae bacterium]|nr:hypothetical protein [Ignavibacteria bacterium]MBI3363557.1 hypothetical protein [Ignavibacteriota bacterium]